MAGALFDVVVPSASVRGRGQKVDVKIGVVVFFEIVRVRLEQRGPVYRVKFL